MQNYSTVADKATEWNLSPRHVQYLCRNGKIEGAIKRSEVWFIPTDAPSPAKKTKTGGQDFVFVGTKRKIFYSAIELFMLKGFDSVSLRDIANKVRIRQSTIYNHFKSKQEILDTLYDFYCHFYLKDRPSIEAMQEMLQSASLSEILKAIAYNFDAAYMQEMSDITNIIFQRIAVDNRAREIAKSLMLDEGIRYVETIFNMGVESGRFAPFDVHALAVFINSSRIFTLYNWIIDPSPEGMAQLMRDEQVLYMYADRFLENPPTALPMPL